MSSLIVPVAEIQAIKPHSNADSLEIAQVLGWQTVVPKGQYQAGDRVVYFPPDTLLPFELSERLGVTKYLDKQRIRCTKLRQEPSFGLVATPEQDWPVGENVATYYGVTKWEPPVREWRGGSRTAPTFKGYNGTLPEPSAFWRYTGIENMRHYPNAFKSGEEVVVTEKIHGTNSRVAIIAGEVMAGSHRTRRAEPAAGERDLYWSPLAQEGVQTLLRELGEHHQQVILFGEIYGPDIQSYSYGLDAGAWGYRAFDLLIDGHYVDHFFFQAMCQSYRIETVPVLASIPFDLEQIRALSEGPTTLIAEGAHIREGVVVRPRKERMDPKVGRLVLKYVSDAYLLSHHSDFSEL